VITILKKFFAWLFRRKRAIALADVQTEPGRIIVWNFSGRKVRKHLRRCRTLCRDSMLFADHATLPYGLGQLRKSKLRFLQHGF
jgi:hypothetical protein